MPVRILLPPDEIAYLATLAEAHPSRALYARLADLHQAGWSLQSLASSLTPPRPKSTVQYWVQSGPPIPPSPSGPPLPLPPRPPRALTGLPAVPRVVPRLIPAAERPQLASLAVLARRYRAKTPTTSPAAQANLRLTELACHYRALGVPTADIAQAAGVSYRAMARRVSHAASV